MFDIEKIEPVNALALYQDKTGLDPLIDGVRETVRNFQHDLSTAKGRAATASLAAKVSKAKVFLDDLGKNLTEEWKQKSKVVDNVRKKMRDELDALRDEARLPLTAWENAEKMRVEDLENKIQKIRSFESLKNTSNEYIQALSDLLSIEIGEENHAERTAEALILQKNISAFLQNKIEEKQKEEADREELARLRAEAEARAKADREEALRKEGELRAQREAEARIKAEQARIESEAKAKEEAASRATAEAETRARNAEISEQRAKAAAEAAAQIAQRKLEEAEASALAKKAEQEKADEANKTKNRKAKTEAKLSLIALGIEEKTAINIVIAISENKINNVKMVY
jgi:hypothetical protein